jgi:hypothetical protein
MSVLIVLLFLGGTYPLFGELNYTVIEYQNLPYVYSYYYYPNSIYSYVCFAFFVGLCAYVGAFIAWDASILSNMTFFFFAKHIHWVSFLFASHYLWFLLKLFFVLWLFIAIRAIVPRYRYDQLMILGWKNFLPLSLFFFIAYGMLFIYYNNIYSGDFDLIYIGDVYIDPPRFFYSKEYFIGKWQEAHFRQVNFAFFYDWWMSFKGNSNSTTTMRYDTSFFRDAFNRTNGILDNSENE